jgi:hypothetical protein
MAVLSLRAQTETLQRAFSKCRRLSGTKWLGQAALMMPELAIPSGSRTEDSEISMLRKRT